MICQWHAFLHELAILNQESPLQLCGSANHHTLMPVSPSEAPFMFIETFLLFKFQKSLFVAHFLYFVLPYSPKF